MKRRDREISQRRGGRGNYVAMFSGRQGDKTSDLLSATLTTVSLSLGLTSFDLHSDDDVGFCSTSIEEGEDFFSNDFSSRFGEAD